MNYPPTIHTVAAKADVLVVRHFVDWQTIAQQNDGFLDEMLWRQAAQKLTQEFVHKVRNRIRTNRTENSDGVEIRMETVALRYDQLMELLYEAYREGQSDRMAAPFHPVEVVNG